MNNNQLQNISKPVQIFKHPAGRNFWAVMADSTAGQNDVEPFYSQEYVSALLAELEEKDRQLKTSIRRESAARKGFDEQYQRALTAEAKLATPVRLPEGLAKKIKVTDYYEALNEMMDCVRAAGFKCVGDE